MRTLDAKGYKRGALGESRQAGVRSRIVAALREAMPWLSLDEEHEAACIADDDRLDALVSAFVARAAATRRTVRPPHDDRDAATREGWIHVPSVDTPLGALRAQPATSRST